MSVGVHGGYGREGSVVAGEDGGRGPAVGAGPAGVGAGPGRGAAVAAAGAARRARGDPAPAAAAAVRVEHPVLTLRGVLVLPCSSREKFQLHFLSKTVRLRTNPKVFLQTCNPQTTGNCP